MLDSKPIRLYRPHRREYIARECKKFTKRVELSMYERYLLNAQGYTRLFCVFSSVRILGFSDEKALQERLRKSLEIR